MSSFKFDRKVWEFIGEFYEKNCKKLEEKRKKNQLEAYWCRPAGENQALFTDPKQRMFARFLRSYLNTTWHKIGKGNGSIIDWFDFDDIIKNANAAVKDNLLENKPLKSFCESILLFIEKLELNDYCFEQEQTENFDRLSKLISKFFEDKEKELKVSRFEEIIYENICEPYRTIMKMQKLFPGFGIALSCDFLKESHLCNIAKPDIHLCHVFSLIDGIPYSMDLALVKRVAEFAANVCPADKNNFCGSGAYNVDKVIWQICSNYDVDNDTKKKSFKEDFLDELANLLKK
ncbi:MAG: hypothetical protein E7050_06145 [Lentisphaerae bacterium]|nr:hypothetical protein [Lentisphaerota bacterium]